MPQTVWVSWSELVGVRVAVRGCENQLQTEGLRLSVTPGWAAHQNETECCYSQRNLGSICCSLFRLQLNSHTQPFRNPFENKAWEVYFSKEVYSFVIIVDYVSACICIRIVVSWLYTILSYLGHPFQIFFFCCFFARSGRTLQQATLF